MKNFTIAKTINKFTRDNNNNKYIRMNEIGIRLKTYGIQKYKQSPN